jgi:hypothetical protein
MGMDVFGTKPTAKQGKYFRRNIWHWHPLAECCLDLAPDECRPCECWHSNDGDGLDAEQSVLLARRLQQLLSDGTVAEYIGRDLFDAPYTLDVEDVTDFIAFLLACGGFTIL